MPQLTLSAGANPAFLSKNYVNRDCVVTVSSSDSLKHRLYQMDFTAPWASAGSDDTITETITVAFYQGSLAVARSIDFIALMAINLKNFYIEYSNDEGATWTAVSGGDYKVATGNFAGSDLVLTLSSPITATTLRVSMYRTLTTNAEKSVGGLVAALATMQAANGMSDYDPKRPETRRDVKMADGSISYGVQYRSDNSFEFYECKVKWRFVTAAYRALFLTVKRTVEPVLWYPEPGDEVRGLYLARIKPRTFKDPYSTTYKGAGYDIEFEVEEVGGG